jgi:uncharacterized protein (DUF983 family)
MADPAGLKPDAISPGVVLAGLKGLCPRCGAPSLFCGAIRLAPRCRACGLDIAAFNLGDGPAAFLTLIMGTVVTTLAIVLELGVHPPIWLHILLWVPITVLGVIGSLRIAKGMLIAAEYRNRAREGRIAPGDPGGER